MADPAPVTLQINVAPTDLPHAVAILPHQLRNWAGQVQEIIFTLDLHRSAKGGRFAEGWAERLPTLEGLLQDLCGHYPAARVVPVDYDPQAMEEVAHAFFGGPFVPTKDTRGGPFYSYFHGLHAARHELVLHLDSDLMFGGGSQSWIGEAVELLARRPDVLTCSPLPGPPTADGTLRREVGEPVALDSRAFRFESLSTRLFLLDRARLRDRVCPLPLTARIRLRSRLKARIQGNPPYPAPELLLSEAMRRSGLCRIDFLGSGSGMWSLHPPYRSQQFYEQLPALIERIERGDVPDGQRGDYDVNDNLFDWSSARRRFLLRRLWA